MTPRHLIILSLLLLASTAAWAQETDFCVPDSLMAKLKENRGTDLKRAEALDGVIMFYFGEHRISEAVSYINDMEDVANSIRDNYWIAKSHYFQALVAYEIYDNAKFFLHANEALRIAETLRENETSQLLLARIYLVKSACFFNNSLIPESEECVKIGLNIAEKNGFKELRHSFLNNKGSIYIQLEKHNEAIRIFKDLIRDKFDLLPMLDIASTYVRLQQYDSVLYYTDSIINYALHSENKMDSYCMISAYQVKSVSFIALNRYDEAIQCLDASFNRKNGCDDKSLVLTYYLHYAEALCGLGQYELALENIDKAIYLAIQTGLIEAEWYATKIKIEILDNIKDYKQEVLYMNKYITLTDTINKRENNEKIQLQNFQRETLELEKQYSFDKQIMKQRHRFTLICFSLILLIVILLVTIITISMKRKQDKTKSSLEARNREVTSQTMEQIHFNRILNDVITNLTHYINNPKGNSNAVDAVIRDLKSILDDGSEKDFDFYFTQVHPDFYKKLQTDFPNLTANDLRLCAFIKNNLNVKEVAEMTGITIDSVKAARSRLRRKLGITDQSISLYTFLSKY